MPRPGAKRPKFTKRNNGKDIDVDIDVDDDIADNDFLTEIGYDAESFDKRVFFKGKNMLLNQHVTARLAKCATKHGFKVTFTIQKNDPLNIPTLFQLGIDSTIEESDGP